MDQRESFFNEYFANWSIELSDDVVLDLEEGKIIQIVAAGWTIKVLFDEDNQGKYMDFYAGHRMTNDRHVRVRSDGSTKGLPTLSEMRLCSRDPEEDERLEQEFQASNRKVMNSLEEKGFGIRGQEHPSFLIQKYQLGQFSSDESDATKNEDE